MKSYTNYTLRSKARKVISLALVLTLLFTMFNVGAIAQVVLNLGHSGTPTEGSSLKITWNKMDDADHYEYSVRNTTTDTKIYDHKSTTSTSFTISGKYLIANNSYRVWVGAYRPEDVEGWPPATHTAEWEFTVPDDTCYHDGKTYQHIIKKNYKSISDTQHRVTTIYDLCCYDCDEVLKENQVLEEIDDHFLDENGDCKLCDYTYSCPHTKSEVDVEKSGYLPEDEDTHIYFETGHYVCANANCGKEIKPYDHQEKEEHTFKNNTCKYCGYTKAESLSVTVARRQQTAVTGESISATVTAKGGSGSFEYAWEVICDGTVVDRTDYSRSTSRNYVTTKPGNWQFKVYARDTVSKEEVTATTSTITVSEATCNHTNKKDETIYTDYIKTSDTKHEIRTYYNVVCDDCGDVLSEGNYSSEIVDHVVGASGQCICGYTAPTENCEHTTSKPVQIDQRTEQYDEKWHKVITTYQDICANNECGVILVASREETAMVAHTYDSNGKCACGYVQPTDKCDHAPIETLVDTDYAEIDGTNHEIIRKYHYECECGQVNYDDIRTATEPHVFENGTCVCGRTEAGAITYGGSFSQDSYTMTVGEKLNVDVTASTTNANLSRVTVNADSTGNDRLAYADIKGGTNWNGTLTLDGSIAPLNVPGTYTIKLFVKVNNDENAWAEVDQATLVVTNPNDPALTVTYGGSFSQDSYTMTLGEKLDVDVTASTTNANLSRVTVNADSTGNDRLAYADIKGGTNWNGTLTLDGSIAPLNVPGTYTIKLFVKVNNDENAWAEVDQATLVVTKLPDPVLTVAVDGAKMIASWEDVPGAVRYVFSLRKTSEPNGDPLYNHVETNGCSITLDLEPGVEYKLAVAAVPAGVEDTKAETKRCSWGLATFTTETLEEINTPKVLKVETDMKANFLLPGEEVTIKVTCNKATKYLDVYDPAYRTLKDPKFNKEGYPYFEYIVSYAAVGKMELRFIALDEQLEWSRKKEHQGFLDIIVCDHTTTPKLISTSNATKKDRNVHTVTETYEDACLCGKVSNTWSKEVDKPHTWGALQASKTHTQGKGHRRFYECTACHQVKDADYVSFLVGEENAKKCSTCWARYELISELQKLLSERGYNIGKAGIDGIFGNDTKNAMNAFRKDVMKLGPIDDVDEATMAALRNGSVEKTPLAGKILEPGNGDAVEFFKDGVLKISWRPLDGNWNYTLTLREGDTVVFSETINGNNASSMTKYIYADSYGMKKYTEEEKKQDHIITISITAVPAQ